MRHSCRRVIELGTDAPINSNSTWQWNRKTDSFDRHRRIRSTELPGSEPESITQTRQVTVGPTFKEFSIEVELWVGPAMFGW